jgi:hypothetical protein
VLDNEDEPDIKRKMSSQEPQQAQTKRDDGGVYKPTTQAYVLDVLSVIAGTEDGVLQDSQSFE